MAPTTTTALAGRLALSPSTVSEHLSVLVTARLAVRRRSSNQVFYELSANGRALVSRFSDGISGGRGE
jgi:DNA-binding transcriptional ArsR family regulator